MIQPIYLLAFYYIAQIASATFVVGFRNCFKVSQDVRLRYTQKTRLDALGVKIRIVGKPTKSASSDQKWLEDAADVYHKRIRPNGVDIETIWHKQDADLVKGVATDQSKVAIAKHTRVP